VLEQYQSHPMLQQYRYRLGMKGIAAYLLKESALRTMPSVAHSLWTYHSSLLIRSRASNESTAAPPRSGPPSP
jgi:hypothetical protein